MHKRQYDVPARGELHVHVPFFDSKGVEISHAVLTLEQPLMVNETNYFHSAKDEPNSSGLHLTPQISAEMFGTELPIGIPLYIPSGAHFGVYTPTGCVLTVEAIPEVLNECYSCTLGSAYHCSLLDINYYLEQKRREAKINQTIGPCILFCGISPESGKSTAARTLANYAVRLGYHPLYCDLCVQLPQFGFPNCINVYNLQYPVDIENNVMFTPGHHIFYGYPRITDNAGLFKYYVSEAFNSCLARMATSDRARCGGVFIDFPTIDKFLVEEIESERHETSAEKQIAMQRSPFELLKYVISVFRVDVVIVSGSSWLKRSLFKNMNIQKHPSGSQTLLTFVNGDEINEINVIALESSDSTAHHSDHMKEIAIRQKWDHYFTGTPSIPLKCYTLEVPINSIRFIQVTKLETEQMQTLLALDSAADEPPQVSIVNILMEKWESRPLVALCDAYFMRCTPNNIDPFNLDAKYIPVEDEEFEMMARQSKILGFAFLVNVDHSNVRFKFPAERLPQSQGCCFLMNKEKTML